MKIKFTKRAYKDFHHWKKQDKKIEQKTKELIKDITRTPYEGLGNPKQLKKDLSGWWSRRITKQHRLVYKVEAGILHIRQCRYHYDD